MKKMGKHHVERDIMHRFLPCKGCDLARDPRCVMDSFVRVGGIQHGSFEWDPFFGGDQIDANMYGDCEGFPPAKIVLEVWVGNTMNPC